MQYELTSNMNYKSTIPNVMNWLFGFLVAIIGVINILWGNDQAFGAFLLMLSFVYFPPANKLLSEFIGVSIPGWLNVLLGCFIIIAALGVGELPAKIDMMLIDLA